MTHTDTKHRQEIRYQKLIVKCPLTSMPINIPKCKRAFPFQKLSFAQAHHQRLQGFSDLPSFSTGSLKQSTFSGWI